MVFVSVHRLKVRHGRSSLPPSHPHPDRTAAGRRPVGRHGLDPVRRGDGSAALPHRRRSRRDGPAGEPGGHPVACDPPPLAQGPDPRQIPRDRALWRILGRDEPVVLPGLAHHSLRRRRRGGVHRTAGGGRRLPSEQARYSVAGVGGGGAHRPCAVRRRPAPGPRRPAVGLRRRFFLGALHPLRAQGGRGGARLGDGARDGGGGSGGGALRPGPCGNAPLLAGAPAVGLGGGGLVQRPALFAGDGRPDPTAQSHLRRPDERGARHRGPVRLADAGPAPEPAPGVGDRLHHRSLCRRHGHAGGGPQAQRLGRGRAASMQFSAADRSLYRACRGADRWICDRGSS